MGKFTKLEFKKKIDNEVITTTKLKPNEAIGKPDRKDYPILKGKEVLLNAEFKGFIGQAYTDSPKNFKGSLKEVLELDLKIERNMPIFIATLNSVMRSLELCDRTIHCKDKEPRECAIKFSKFLKKNYNKKKIALIGLQPGILSEISKDFNVRVLDLDKDNIGSEKCGAIIEHGIKDYESVISWADIVLATGSTVCNETITSFLNINKPVYFYGTSIAGIAKIMNLDRLCFCAK